MPVKSFGNKSDKLAICIIDQPDSIRFVWCQTNVWNRRRLTIAQDKYRLKLIRYCSIAYINYRRNSHRSDYKLVSYLISHTSRNVECCYNWPTDSNTFFDNKCNQTSTIDSIVTVTIPWISSQFILICVRIDRSRFLNSARPSSNDTASNDFDNSLRTVDETNSIVDVQRYTTIIDYWCIADLNIKQNIGQKRSTLASGSLRILYAHE
jgi:hypothetical protein